MGRKGSIYPFKMRVYEPDIEKIWDDIKQFNTHTVKGDKTHVHQIGYDIAPIRDDFNIAWDSRTGETVISKKNKLMKIEKKGKDYIFSF